MDAFGGYFVDEKAVLVENIFLNFLKVMMVTIRFEPYLKNACRRFVMELSSTFISDDNPNKIKRANNSRNWETGVSTGVVTCTSARVRMQETSKEIPAGSLPRSLNVILRHDIVEQARAGDMCQRAPSTGSEKPLLLPCIYSQFSAGSSTAGLIPDVWPMVVKLDEVQRMRNAPDLFNKLVDSISPTVFGHQDIKRALLLMLFGGVHNFTHEGVNLREDIDACIVGDPSCAKSQSLKYTSGIVPRSVYTSGKSSSATGLTATVAKEPETAEFCIEVAIHEAMEQQAISITKAVMQATLNARTSILAAANPTGGHFDKSKPLKYNVVLPPSILSRFDLVYVMIGDPNNQTDTTLRTILGDTTVGSRVAYRMTEIDLSEIQEANHDDGVGALVMRLRQHEEAVMRDGRNLNNDGSGSWTLFSYCPGQGELIRWYVEQQSQKNSYSSVEEAKNEASKIKAIIEAKLQQYLSLANVLDYSILAIYLLGLLDMTNVVLQSLIRKEGSLIVVDYGSRPEAEGDGARQSSSKDDRILAVMPNHVVE
ncbi:hypothetical protein POTOM_012442 [Populus tomentosa]|uniref:MCM C-terminal AAA(+) ATPase domain-containing protein n=1 Tax=Populus tomentosa TaxID=118781 RepID=A0A8X8AAF9_POPTO|nr:hypothetical protein POTOM_012442 [Populus tomentosa]